MSQHEPDRAYVYQPGPSGMPSTLFRCRICRQTWKKIDCPTRFGMAECPRCLPKAYVGVLEPVIYGVAGPCTYEHEGKLFTKDDADGIVAGINGRLAIDTFFGQGDASKCKICRKDITLRGSRWLDRDGTMRCERGHIHSPSGRSDMPHRLKKPRIQP